MELLNTLYITSSNSYLRVENQTLRLDIDGHKFNNFPTHHFDTVVCFGDVMMTPAVVRMCAQSGISLIFLEHNGRFRARLEGPISGNVLLRQAQYKQSQNDECCRKMATLFIGAKIRNSRNILLRGAREAKSQEVQMSLQKAADSLRASMRNLMKNHSLDELRGIEGEAARVYFSVFSCLIADRFRDDFAMNGRNRRPPRDRINALLSFLYALLLNDSRSSLETVGLDTQVGFLHAVRPGRAALALDIMEEMRSFFADRLVLSIINRGQVAASDFIVREGGAVEISDKARKTIIVVYQNRKKDKISHPLLKIPVELGLLPFLQARLLSRAIRGEIPDYLPYVIK